MMPTRYIAVTQRGSVRGDDHQAAMAGSGLTVTLLSDRAIVATSEPAPLMLANGILIGSIYRRGETRPVIRLSDTEKNSIQQSGGSCLIKEYWGSYIAILIGVGEPEAIVIRAPLGALPCLYTRTDNGAAVASDVALLTSVAGYHPSIDWDGIGRHLAVRDLRFDQTCLAGIKELHGGDRLAIGRGLIVAPLWSPCSFASRERQLDQLSESVDRVRAATLESVAARASEFERSVLMLSGGLDSSIVAAALTAAGHDVDCLCLTTRDCAGDERDYAAAVASTLGVPLTLVRREVARIDVMRSAAAHLPRPVARAFAQESTRAAIERARATGARAIFTGGGGDNVFCSLQSGAPAADRLLTSGPGRAFVQTASEVSSVASSSLVDVGRDAVRRAWRRRLPFRPSLDPRLLSPAAIAVARMTPPHPWLADAASLLPGKAAHLRLLAYAQSYVESFDPLADIAMVAPLLSQPLVETCLRVPSWLWFSGGRNRSVARQAFARDLPAATIGRRSKGSPESFVGEIFDCYRPIIKTMLLDGHLARQGIIERPAVAEALADPRPAHGTAFMRLLEFVDVEAWVDGWY